MIDILHFSSAGYNIIERRSLKSIVAGSGTFLKREIENIPGQLVVCNS